MSEPLVSNAASEKQVKRAKRREKDGDTAHIKAMKAVLSTPEGKAVIWRILEHCSVFSSIWHPSAQIHYNAGRQDVGHWLTAVITAADPRAFINLMELNAPKKKKSD